MILTIDIGNSQMYCGVFKDEDLLHTFRMTTSMQLTSDQMGLFLTGVLREKNIDREQIKGIAVCSVVPGIMHTVKNACLKYFKKSPFVLQPGVKTGLRIQYRNPSEVGADRIANAIAGMNLFPKQNIMIVDFGTATTLCLITDQKDYLGGVIFPGVKISMQALESKTAKLPLVEITIPNEIIGRSTEESIQSGLYYSHLFSVKQMIEKIKKDYVKDQKVVVIGTGGFSRLFAKEKLFDVVVPDMVLNGLRIALLNNC